jgi:hypothetical protein
MIKLEEGHENLKSYMIKLVTNISKPEVTTRTSHVDQFKIIALMFRNV